MVTEVLIEDNKKAPLGYISELKNFENGKKFEFKPYVNIIVGPNGCGKSTLLKLISRYMFCDHTMYSHIPSDYKNIHLFNTLRQKGDMFLGGVSVKADYNGLCFRYKPVSEYTDEDTNSSVENFALFFDGKSSSIGQQSMQAVQALFSAMFKQGIDVNFPMKTLCALFKNGESLNDVWTENYKQMVDYYRRNQVSITQEDFQFTVLMDEPDRNLDVENIEDIYAVLSTEKELTQVIAVVHNPILIYRLAKLDRINIIEMEPGYVERIKKFVEDGTK